MTILNNPGIVAASLPQLLQSTSEGRVPSEPETARRRLFAVSGDPFLFADWERLLFLHFLIAPELVRPHVPRPFELELYEDKACISIVALTMRDFRPCHFDPLALPFSCLREQRFLNFRTYVRWQGEPGAFFLHGWLSRPWGFPAPSNLFSLPYTFANSTYEHLPENRTIRGTVSDGKHQFAYRGSIPEGTCQRAEPDSLAEFAMERYSGFYCRGSQAYVFRAWHPAWRPQAVVATIEQDDLIAGKFPWWKEAQFAGANFAPGFERVELGKAHRLPEIARGHRVLSRLFELP